MKTDKELLELAAKAAGIDGSVDDEFGCGMWLRGKRNPDNSRYWSPLTDDGDALRLAVHLKISGIASEVWVIEQTSISEFESNPYAATRHAIVRAAAAIGETM